MGRRLSYTVVVMIILLDDQSTRKPTKILYLYSTIVHMHHQGLIGGTYISCSLHEIQVQVQHQGANCTQSDC